MTTTTITRLERLRRTALLLGVLALTALAGATAAGALPNPDPNDDPRLPTPLPNLVFSAGSVTAAGTSQWEIAYTVANRGTASAGPFRVIVQQNATTTVKETAHASLAPGASRSETIRIPRNDCFTAIRFVADSTRVVHESREDDNAKTAIALTSPTCTTQPRYAVKAVSFHVNDESGIDLAGSDEPYWMFSSVGASGTARTTSSHVFQSADTGDTFSFGATEGCIYVSCSGGVAPNGIGFSIQLREQDLGELAAILKKTKDAFDTAGPIIGLAGAPGWATTAVGVMSVSLGTIVSWAEDDLLGSETFAYDPTYLASRLPSVGNTFTDSRRFVTGGALGSDYTLTLQFTRVG
jgi:hypothetical protein